MVDEEKEAIRRRVWEHMERTGVARFPTPVVGRIPNFVGAERAAERATQLSEWRRAEVIKSNPDSPQAPLRRIALEEGKRLYMAVPRLREAKCLILLDPAEVRDARAAASISGAFRAGRPTHPRDMEKIDLVVAGSVAVNRQGARIGKGGGYSDLEFALARHFGLVSESTPVLTTVHACQILDESLPMRSHDEPVSLIVTPEETIHAGSRFPKPQGILWTLLMNNQIESMPVLRDIARDGA